MPQLYSKLAASQELRKMLNIGGQKERPRARFNYHGKAQVRQKSLNRNGDSSV